MFGIGMPELIVILVILLIVFGASRLPEIGAGLGKGIKNFKKSVTETEKGLSAAGDESKESTDDKEKTG